MPRKFGVASTVHCGRDQGLEVGVGSKVLRGLWMSAHRETFT